MPKSRNEASIPWATFFVTISDQVLPQRASCNLSQETTSSVVILCPGSCPGWSALYIRNNHESSIHNEAWKCL